MRMVADQKDRSDALTGDSGTKMKSNDFLAGGHLGHRGGALKASDVLKKWASALGSCGLFSVSHS